MREISLAIVDGEGDSYGYCCGDGSGHGCGYGYGDGYGDGDGSGSVLCVGYDWGDGLCGLDVACIEGKVTIGCESHPVAAWLGEVGERLASEYEVPAIVQSCFRAWLQQQVTS